MEIPFWGNEQFAVGKAEYNTGIVLNNDGTFFTSGDNLNKMYELFNSYQEAKDFATQKIKDNQGIYLQMSSQRRRTV